ncbi:MAG: DUF3787 domain-containing protein [Eubacteriales bacterium]|nr:DUF3787 domain-containing protein [Eubacteriales bacterium]MDD3199004.1 DUF3787 domain-containing protein [Eubacteriales bacterium]MDD4122018.1 DUF3787 domain-containing protein [Eubacteriales bacterium]MDD4629510.1 DUF3787 domain-containing protein [Eubacteriales bacterium]
MKKSKTANFDYTPKFTNFPLANSDTTINESRVSEPSEDDVEEVKEWVDFKEM